MKAVLWENDRKNDRGEKFTATSIQIVRTYKDGETWKESSSYRKAELPNVQAVERAAYDFLALKEREPDLRGRKV